MNKSLVVDYQSSGFLSDSDGREHRMFLAQFNGLPIYFDENHKPLMSQSDIAEMFGIEQQTVAYHVKRAKEQGILKESDYRKFRYTASDGKTYSVAFYDMTMISTIGFRVQDVTPKVLAFIEWAGAVLNHHLTTEYREHIARLQSENENLADALTESEKAVKADAFWAIHNKREAYIQLAEDRHSRILVDNWED